MLPCKKITNGAYAARYLKRADRLARSIKSNSGKKTNIIDGCILQGSKTGRVMSASSIEPPGKILSCYATSIPSNLVAIGMFDFDFEVGTRELFHPNFKNSGSSFESAKLKDEYYYKKGVFFGLPPLTGRIVRRQVGMNIANPTSINTDQFFHYVPVFGLDQNEHYFVVFMRSMATGEPEISVTLHESYIKGIADDYSVNYELLTQSMSAAVIETGYGTFTAILTVGKEIYRKPGTNGGGIADAKHKTRLLMLNIDLKLSEKDAEPTLDHYLFPEALIPSNMLPSTVLIGETYGDEVVAKTVPAPSVMSIQDIDIDNNGRVIAAIKYQVKIQRPSQDTPYQGGGIFFEGHEGTGVMAYGLACWGQGDDFFNIHSTEVVDGDPDDELVTMYADSATEAIFGERQTIINGSVHRWGLLVSRRTAGIFAIGAWSGYSVLPPYIIELKNGMPTGFNAVEHPTDLIAFAQALYYQTGVSVDFERDFFINGNWLRNSLSGQKAKVSQDCVAIPAGNGIETLGSAHGEIYGVVTTSAGLLFIQGDRRKFEKVCDLGGLQDSYAMTVSCHQQEVRDYDGALVMPSAILVCAYKDGKPKLFIRKGPIWPEDFGEGNNPDDYSGFWTEVDTPGNDRVYYKYVYVGNPLMLGKHGNLFA